MRRRSAGEGKVGAILWSLAFIIVIMIAWKAIPVKIASAELYDFMVDQAKFSGRVAPPELKKRILQQAKELDIPLEEKNVFVERNGDTIRMSAKYVVALDFPGYTYYWNFDHQVKRQIFDI